MKRFHLILCVAAGYIVEKVGGSGLALHCFHQIPYPTGHITDLEFK